MNGKVLVPGAVARSSVMRKKLSSEALDRRGPFSGSPFRCWGLKGVQLHCGRPGTRKRCRLDTPPFQSPGGGVVRRPHQGRDGERGRCGGSASSGSGAPPSQLWEGAGPPLPEPLGTLRGCPGKASVQQMHAGGWGRGRGGEEKTHNKTCVAERTARLEWKEPALAERCRDSGERAGPAGRGAGAQQVPGSGGRLGPGVRAQPGQRILTSRLVRTARQLPGAEPSHLAPQLEPCTEGMPGSSPSGVQPQTQSGPSRGLSSSLARGWSQPLGHSRCAHLERI